MLKESYPDGVVRRRNAGMAWQYQEKDMVGEMIPKKKLQAVQLGEKGDADITMLVRGKLIAIEVKRDVKEYKKWQKYKRRSKYEKGYDERIEYQKKRRNEIIRAGGHFILTFSRKHLRLELEKIFK